MKLWYLAHPYISNPEKNFKEVNKIGADLVNRGYFIFSPISMTHPIDVELIKQEIHKSNEFWYEFDFVTANRCDGLILSGKWSISKGCLNELTFFEDRSKPVLLYIGVGQKMERFK